MITRCAVLSVVHCPLPKPWASWLTPHVTVIVSQLMAGYTLIMLASTYGMLGVTVGSHVLGLFRTHNLKHCPLQFSAGLIA